MQNWPKPKTIKALRGFLCLIGYYRKFIQGYEKIARLLAHMLKGVSNGTQRQKNLSTHAKKS